MSNEAKAATEEQTSDGKIPAALLKQVRRPVTDKKGQVQYEGTGDKAKPKMRAISADEVLTWSERNGQIVVVTTDGQKFRGEK